MQKTLRLRPYRVSDSDYYDFCDFDVSVCRSSFGDSFCYFLVGEYMDSNFAVHRVFLDVFSSAVDALDVSDFFSDLLRLANDAGFTPKSAVESLADKYDDMDLYDVCSSFGYDLVQAVSCGFSNGYCL